MRVHLLFPITEVTEHTYADPLYQGASFNPINMSLERGTALIPQFAVSTDFVCGALDFLQDPYLFLCICRCGMAVKEASMPYLYAR